MLLRCHLSAKVGRAAAARMASTEAPAARNGNGPVKERGDKMAQVSSEQGTKCVDSDLGRTHQDPETRPEGPLKHRVREVIRSSSSTHCHGYRVPKS